MSGTLRLRGATSGYSELQAPAVAADQTFILPTAGGTLLTTDSPVPKLTLELGSASQPSLTFEGDTDTGLYSSGTNTLNLVTGGNNRLTIDSSGNVGIGTASPSAPLMFGKDVYGDPGDENFYRIKLKDNNGIANDVGIGMPDASSIGFNTVSNGNIIFYNGTDGESMRIDSSGNVGIGTTSPSEQLEIYSTSGHRLKVSRTTTAIELFQPASASPMLNASGTGVALRFGINDTEAARIDSSGNVGIGTSSPGALLHVNSVSTTEETATFYSNASKSVPSVSIWQDGAGSTGPALRIRNDGSGNALEIQDNSVGNNVLVVDTAGRVGIGTTSPGAELHVNPGAGNVGNIFLDYGTGSSADGRLNVEVGSSAAFYETVKTGGLAQAWYVTGAERMRIDTSGRLLVGTSTTRQQASNGGVSSIQIEGTSSAVAGIQLTSNVNNTGGSYLFMGKTRATINGGVTAVQSGDLLASLQFTGADGTSLHAASSINAEVDGTPGANDMPGRLVFSTTADGASSPTERMRITSAGSVEIDSFNNLSAGYALRTGFLPSAFGGSGMMAKDHSGSSRDGCAIYGHDGISFHTNGPTERMRIDSAGGMRNGPIIADNTNGAGEYFSSGGFIGIQNYTFSTSAYCFQVKTGSPTMTVRMVIRNDGDLENANNRYGAYSDASLKENIVDANSQWDDIKTIRVRNYNFKEETGHSTHRQIGVIAQELETSSPGLVSDSSVSDDEGNPTGKTYKTVSYSVLYVKAVKALQEAMERIETLEASNADLLARVTALEGA